MHLLRYLEDNRDTEEDDMWPIGGSKSFSVKKIEMKSRRCCLCEKIIAETAVFCEKR